MSISSGRRQGTEEPPGTTRFQGASVGNAAAHFVDGLSQIVAQGKLVDAGAGDVSAEVEQARAAVALDADFGILLAAHEQDGRNAGEGLGVVDDRRPAPESDDGRKRRTDAGNAALAFERLHEGGLFADLVGSGAAMPIDLEIVAGAEDVLAADAARIGVGDSLLHDLQQVAVLAADIDVGGVRADGDGGDHGAFDDGVGIVLEDEAVLAGSGLALIAVAEYVLGLGALLGDERPLHARGESGAAASAEIAGLHLVDDGVGTEFEGLPHGLVAVEFEIAVEVGSAETEAPADDFDLIGMGDQVCHSYWAAFCLYSSRIWSIFSGVRFSWKS